MDLQSFKDAMHIYDVGNPKLKKEDQQSMVEKI